MNPETPSEPTPELLAAFADDELEPAARDAVERWLSQHHDTRHEVEAHQQLVRLYQGVYPPEPSESAWASALAGIRSRTLPIRPRGPRRILRWSIGVAAAVALITVIALAMSRPESLPKMAKEEPPLPVASSEVVIVTSLDDTDRGLFVVGELPLVQDEELVLASNGDVDVVDLKPEPGMNLKFQRGESTTPMIFAEPSQEDKNSEVPLPK